MKQPIDDYIEEMREQFYENGTLYASTFNILERHKKIKLTDKEIERYVRQARMQCKAEGVDVSRKGNDRHVSDEAKKIAVGAIFSKMKLRERV